MLCQVWIICIITHSSWWVNFVRTKQRFLNWRQLKLAAGWCRVVAHFNSCLDYQNTKLWSFVFWGSSVSAYKQLPAWREQTALEGEEDVCEAGEEIWCCVLNFSPGSRSLPCKQRERKLHTESGRAPTHTRTQTRANRNVSSTSPSLARTQEPLPWFKWNLHPLLLLL